MFLLLHDSSRIFLQDNRFQSWQHFSFSISKILFACLQAVLHLMRSDWSFESMFPYVCVILLHSQNFLFLGFKHFRASLMAQWVKNLPAMQETQETWVRFLGQEDSLEEETVTHSSILAWEIPWTEDPGRLQQSMGSQRVGHNWANNTFTLTSSTLTTMNLGEIFFIFILIRIAELHEIANLCLSSKLGNLGHMSSHVFFPISFSSSFPLGISIIYNLTLSLCSFHCHLPSLSPIILWSSDWIISDWFKFTDSSFISNLLLSPSSDYLILNTVFFNSKLSGSFKK